MKVGYFVNQFPALSQTFVTAEIKDHLEADLDVEVVVGAPKNELEGALLADTPIFANRITHLDVEPGRRQQLLKFGRVLAEDIARGGISALASSVGVNARERVWAYNLAYAWRAHRLSHDIVHCHFANLGVQAAVLKERGVMQGKLAVTFHGADISCRLDESARDYFAPLFHVGELFLPVSKRWRAELIALGCPRERIHVHHMGIDTERLRFAERRGAANGPVRLICVGRFVEKKGHPFALVALARLRRTRPEIALTLDCAGDGPLLSETKQLAQDLGLGDIVTFHGALPHAETLKLIAVSDLFLLPSVTAADGDMEGIPVVLMEAMAMGLPILSTWHSGIPELVEHGVSGLLAPERDTDELANNIEVFASNRSLWPSFARAGRRMVETEFDRRKLGRELRALYQELLGASDLNENSARPAWRTRHA